MKDFPLDFRLRVRYVMPSAHLSLREEDVVRLALEFLHNRELHISQLSLERETGVINGVYSDDLLFLRQVIFQRKTCKISADLTQKAIFLLIILP
jgi:hypothetical protein